MLSFFPRGVLDEILNLIESVSEGFPSYSCIISSQYMHVASHITCLCAASSELWDRWHATLRPYQECFCHIGQCDGNYYERLFSAEQITAAGGTQTGPLGQQASAKPTELQG